MGMAEGLSVTEALDSRRSVRAFADEPVDRAVLERVLETAQRSASGGNLQPWRAYVLGEQSMALLRSKVRQRLAGDGPPAPPVEYDIYPPKLWSPYRERRFANGEQLYAALEIPREDKPARLGQFAKNWDFFGAPVGLMLYVDRGMGRPQWGDLGIWLQSACSYCARPAGLVPAGGVERPARPRRRGGPAGRRAHALVRPGDRACRRARRGERLAQRPGAARRVRHLAGLTPRPRPTHKVLLAAP